MKKDFTITVQKYGFSEPGHNYLKHDDGILQMRHDSSFDGEIRLFFNNHDCEITFYSGCVFEERFLKYIISKWHTMKERLIERWNTIFIKEKLYIFQNPEYYLLEGNKFEGNKFAMRDNLQEEFSPVIFPILFNYRIGVEWHLSNDDFSEMGFEYDSREEKATYYKHPSKNLILCFSSINTFIYDVNNKKRIEIDRRVYYEGRTLEVLKMLNLLNHPYN